MNTTPHKPVTTLADIVCEDGKPECFHCDEPLPPTADAEVQGTAVVVRCPACGGLTPFKIVS